MQLGEVERRLRSNFYFAAGLGVPLLVLCALTLDELAHRSGRSAWSYVVAGQAVAIGATAIALVLAGRAVPTSIRTGGHGLRQALVVVWGVGLASAAVAVGLALRGFGVALCGLAVVQLAITTYLLKIVGRVGAAVVAGLRR